MDVYIHCDRQSNSGEEGGQEIHSYLDGKLALGEVDVALLGLLQYAGLVLG